MESKAIRCRCGKVIGVYCGTTVIVKLKGRRVSVKNPEEMLISCERCKEITKINPKNL